MTEDNLSIEQLLEDDNDSSKKLGLNIWEKSRSTSIDEATNFVNNLPTPDELVKLGELFKKKYESFLPILDFDSFELLELLSKK